MDHAIEGYKLLKNQAMNRFASDESMELHLSVVAKPEGAVDVMSHDRWCSELVTTFDVNPAEEFSPATENSVVEYVMNEISKIEFRPKGNLAHNEEAANNHLAEIMDYLDGIVIGFTFFKLKLETEHVTIFVSIFEKPFLNRLDDIEQEEEKLYQATFSVSHDAICPVIYIPTTDENGIMDGLESVDGSSLLTVSIVATSREDAINQFRNQLATSRLVVTSSLENPAEGTIDHIGNLLQEVLSYQTDRYLLDAERDMYIVNNELFIISVAEMGLPV